MINKPRLFMTFVFVILLTGFFPGSRNGFGTLWGAIPQAEREALIALYNSTNGDNWSKNTGWKTPPLHTDGFALPGTENTWYGITCDAGNTTVHQVALDRNQLTGSIPPELVNLSNMSVLYLTRNQLIGSIPPELANLGNLEKLNLSSNKLTGSIPTELGNLGNLQLLSLYSNRFTGSIPPELGNLPNLKVLDISINLLTGTIPPELGNLGNLLMLDLCENQLTGSIPPELCNLKNLSIFSLSYNQLVGTIPPGLSNMGNLSIIDFSSNRLVGTILPELCNLTKLDELLLYSNELTGNIPPELGNLVNLRLLFLNDNQFTDTIPPELGKMVKLWQLSLSSNRLTGSIPLELGNLKSLFTLDLSSNHFTGNIPAELLNILPLRSLYLNSNMIVGEIPGEITNLQVLIECDLRWNALYTNNEVVRTFLNSKKIGGNWENTQTIAPAELVAQKFSADSIELSWNPIAYTGDQGGYRVFSSKTTGGPYTYFGQTDTKTNSQQVVDGLEPLTTYYFVLQTRTLPHLNNLNIVDSEYSAEVSATIITYFPISGRVATAAGSGVPGVTLVFSPGNESVITDGDGNYSHDAAIGWSGTLTPSLTGYTFSPTSIEFNNLEEDQPNQDFLAIPVLRQSSISGRVATAEGSGVPGVTLVFSPGNESVITDGDGNYSHDAAVGWSGTLTPSLPGYTFVPLFIEFHNVSTNQTNQNFEAVPIPLFISGKVTSGDEGIPAVTMTFANISGAIETVTTNDQGLYNHQVAYGWTGKVTPSKGSRLFSPPHREYSGIGENMAHQDYTSCVSLALEVSRETDHTVLISKEYGKIKAKVNIMDTTPSTVQKIIFLRVESPGTFIEIFSYSPRGQGNSYELMYTDLDIVEGVAYTYIARALDALGNVIGESKEKSI